MGIKQIIPCGNNWFTPNLHLEDGYMISIAVHFFLRENIHFIHTLIKPKLLR